MIHSTKEIASQQKCISEQTTSKEGFTLIYRLFEREINEHSEGLRPSFDLEITLAGVPAELSLEEAAETTLLEDISRDLQQAMTIAALFAKESVMPCNALEIMEDLLSEEAHAPRFCGESSMAP